MSKIKNQCLLMCLAWLLLFSSAQAELDAERRAQLIYLLKQDCGACHGMRLHGGLGPALTPDIMTQRSSEALQETILNGRANTAMPPWRGLLSEQEVSWLVQYLQSGEGQRNE